MSRPPKRGIESLLSECCCLPSPSQSWQRSGTHTALMAKHHHSGKHPHKAELRASIHQPLLCTVTQEQGCKRKIVKKIPKTKSTTKQPPYATADNEEEKALSIIPPSVKLVLLMSARSFPMAGGRLLSWAIVKTTHGQSWTESSQFSEKAQAFTLHCQPREKWEPCAKPLRSHSSDAESSIAQLQKTYTEIWESV